jgi:hypothetical protein
MRTDKEIQEEIAKLKVVWTKVPKINGFGENNHVAIEAQIKVLENRLREADVEKWPYSSRVNDFAFAAYDWMQGKNGESPSEDWVF